MVAEAAIFSRTNFTERQSFPVIDSRVTGTAMNLTLSERYRCRSVEVKAVSDDLLTWKRDMKLVWYVGESFSIVGFSLLIVTAYIFPVWRRNDQTKVWIQMCFATVLFILVYVNGDFESCKPPVIVFLSIYLGHVAFCWMVAGAWLANRRLVTVFANEKYFMVKSSLFAWLAPLPWDFIRLATDIIAFPDPLFREKRLVIRVLSYKISLRRLLMFVDFLRDVGMYMPVVVAIICSVFLYGRVLLVLWKKRKEWNNRQDLCSVAAICFLFTVMSGIQFVFVIVNRFYTFTRIDLFLAFLITFQVFVNSVLFVFGIRSTREMWAKYVRLKLFGVRSES